MEPKQSVKLAGTFTMPDGRTIPYAFDIDVDDFLDDYEARPADHHISDAAAALACILFAKEQHDPTPLPLDPHPWMATEHDSSSSNIYSSSTPLFRPGKAFDQDERHYWPTLDLSNLEPGSTVHGRIHGEADAIKPYRYWTVNGQRQLVAADGSIAEASDVQQYAYLIERPDSN